LIIYFYLEPLLVRIIRVYFIISFNSYQTFDVINTLKE